MAYFNRDDRQNDRGSYGGGRRDFSDRGDRGGRSAPRGDRTMYPAVCDKCGRDCQVPFRPDGSKPIYCSDCFEAQGGNQKRDNFGGGRKFNDRNSGRSQNQGQNNEVLASINSKLAQILELMRKDEKPSYGKKEKKTEKKSKAKTKATNRPKADKEKKSKTKKKKK